MSSPVLPTDGIEEKIRELLSERATSTNEDEKVGRVVPANLESDLIVLQLRKSSAKKITVDRLKATIAYFTLIC
jgi:hypothetical protein